VLVADPGRVELLVGWAGGARLRAAARVLRVGAPRRAGSTRLSAAPIDGPAGVIEVAAGLHSSYALDADGDVWAVGENPFGELGDGTQIDRAVPVEVVDLAGAVAIAAGYDHGVALLADGTVRAWGWFFPDIETRPVAVPGLEGVIALGPHGSLFLLPPLE
jgi:hypothetical protein